MAADVAVRLWSPTSGIDRSITAEVIEDVQYGALAVGGYDTFTATLSRPLQVPSRDVDPFVNVTVYDPASAETLWDGTLITPGRGNDRGAPLWELAAVGGRQHTTDLPQPLIYVDSRIDQWERVDDFSTGQGVPNATFETTGGTGETPGLRLAFPRGMVVAPFGVVTARYPHLAASGQGIGRATVTHFEGLTTVNAQQELLVRTVALAGSVQGIDQWNTTPQTLVTTRGAIGSSAYRYVDYRTDLTVGGTVNTDVTYSQASDLVVVGTRLTAAGVELVTAGDYPVGYVRPHQVVADLLGRMLPLFDGPGAAVDTTASALIQQLAYENGVDAGQVLTDLMAQAPTHRWAAWERNAAGQHRFEWVPWDTTATILADTADGFTSPGSAADLCDTVKVRWKNPQGRVSWSTFTQANPLLAAAGRHRTKLVDLGSETGSAAAAAAAGQAALDDGLWPSNNGTLTVRRPVQDVVSGRMVHPRELPRYAGRLIQLRDVESYTSTLNPSDRDGSSVYRMAAVTYSSRDRTATVTLDSFEDTVEAALIRSGRLQARQRRL